jgi:hypothetical protein
LEFLLNGRQRWRDAVNRRAQNPAQAGMSNFKSDEKMTNNGQDRKGKES